MNSLDDLLPLIDNGGTRTGAERRQLLFFKKALDRRTERDRRSGADRRRLTNNTRDNGLERRSSLSNQI